MNAVIGENIRFNRLVQIRQLIEEALKDNPTDWLRSYLDAAKKLVDRAIREVVL